MTNFNTFHRLLVVGWLLLLVGGCFKSPVNELPLWQKQSLISGSDVSIRLLWQNHFNNIVFDWPEGQIILSDGNNEIIEQPLQCRRVYLEKYKDSIKVAFKSGKSNMAQAKAYNKVILKSVDNNVMIFNIVIPGIGLRRSYEARAFDCSVKYNRVSIVNMLPIELYIARVLPAEMDPDHFTLEALKAQAVVARTWALRNRRRHLRFGYNFCDSPHCQVYKGRKLISRRAEKATKMTLGEAISIDEKVVDAFYHSTCGGNTVFVHEAWKGKVQSHLSRVEDRWESGHRAYCKQSPYADWTVLTSLRRIEKLLKSEKVLAEKDKLKNIKVDFVNRSGRVLKIILETEEGPKDIQGIIFRRILNEAYGKRTLLSSFFDFDIQGQQVKILGHGLGHGVGLCQWGARGMAQHGFGYRAILKHYFKGVLIKQLYGVPKSSEDGLTQNSDIGKK